VQIIPHCTLALAQGCADKVVLFWTSFTHHIRLFQLACFLSIDNTRQIVAALSIYE
jgi:hypothetical protein